MVNKRSFQYKAITNLALWTVLGWAVLLAVSSCSGPVSGAANPEGVEISNPGGSQGAGTSVEEQAVTLTPVPTATQVTPTPTTPAIPPLSIWIDASIPQGLKQKIEVSNPLEQAVDQKVADMSLKVSQSGKGSAWVYVLVVPFPTVIDDVSLRDIQRAWRGEKVEVFGGSPLLVTDSTLATFDALWGEADPSGVEVAEQGNLLSNAWAIRPSWALVPFEELEPGWKVLRVDGISPLSKTFDLESYPLTARYDWSGISVNDKLYHLEAMLPATNRDPGKMTVVVMTGTTALVRVIASKMESHGMTYPAEAIGDWLREADFTHISNEVAFSPDCPNADPNQKTLRFCSRPEYLQLLEAVHANVIDLTGNHELDWSREAFVNTLQIYRQHGMGYYAGGVNLEEARRPLLLEHNGNRIAFIGCNLVGPPTVWATDSLPGNAACEDYVWIIAEIQRLKQNGYLPIVTLQHNEYFSLVKTPEQEKDFPLLANAGAVIVSGSQAHFPNPFALVDGKFIHYGLGNLFFDQMDYLHPGVQREFIDRHIFYDGRYISTEILTAELEDFSRPRPMTADERAAFLQEAFAASGWK